MLIAIPILQCIDVLNIYFQYMSEASFWDFRSFDALPTPKWKWREIITKLIIVFTNVISFKTNSFLK